MCTPCLNSTGFSPALVHTPPSRAIDAYTSNPQRTWTMSGGTSKVLADIETCVRQIASVLSTLEGCVRALTPSTSRIHRDEPPIIPPELASSLSRASSKYGFQFQIGSNVGKRDDRKEEQARQREEQQAREMEEQEEQWRQQKTKEEADSSVSRSRPQPAYVDWASNLSGLSRASKGGKGTPGGTY